MFLKASSRAVTGGTPSTALPALTSASETVQDGKLSAEQLAKVCVPQINGALTILVVSLL